MTSMPRLPVMDWDYADRLRHTQKGAGAGAQDTYFTYDAAGQRARKIAVASGTLKERIYLGGYEVYRERAAAPGATVDFERQTLHVMDDQRRVAMAETKTVDGGAVVPTPTTRWRFQLDNHLGSATLELDVTGNVISYEEYHPYGSTAFHTANGGAQVSAKRYRYTGKEKDEETGLYYHGARYYAPWLGRWTAADPLTLRQPGSADLCSYAYVDGGPLVAVDPDGQQSAAPRTAADVQADYRRSQVEPPPPDSLEKAARLHGQTEGRAQTLQRELIELNEARQTKSTPRFWSIDHLAASAGFLAPFKSRIEELQSLESTGLTEAGTDEYWHSTVFERAIESGLITSKADQDRFLQIAEDERRAAIYRWAGWRATEMVLSLTPAKGVGAGGVLLARAPQSTSAALSLLNSAAKAANMAGEYINVIESMSKRAIEFQQLVSKGIKAGTSFLRNGVKFDYVDTTRKVLIDAKGPGYGNFVDKAGKFYDWFKGSGALIEQARRQVRAAGGTAIEWVFAEEKALRATQALLDGAGIQGITLRLFK